jgi:hypothetical protein
MDSQSVALKNCMQIRQPFDNNADELELRYS